MCPPILSQLHKTSPSWIEPVYSWIEPAGQCQTIRHLADLSVQDRLTSYSIQGVVLEDNFETCKFGQFINCSSIFSFDQPDFVMTSCVCCGTILSLSHLGNSLQRDSFETLQLESFQTSRLTQVLIANIVESLFQKQHWLSGVSRICSKLFQDNFQIIFKRVPETTLTGYFQVGCRNIFDSFFY